MYVSLSKKQNNAKCISLNELDEKLQATIIFDNFVDKP